MEIGLSKAEFDRLLLERYGDKAQAYAETFEVYAQKLIEVNQHMNLTAIDEPNPIREKHFWDCLAIDPLIPKGSLVADIGSGAGFPGLCLAIVRPDCHFDLIEPTLKRCGFLKEMVSLLKLENVSVLNERAEDVQRREHYDVSTSRAVAKLSVLLELSIPLLKVKGKMIAMKGPGADEEVLEAKQALKLLSCDGGQIFDVHLPSAGLRKNCVFTKLNTTASKYPRSYAQIKKKAL